MIEDTLDLSRIDNNKFSINSEYFDIRTVIKEVDDIMRFQIELKNL